MTVYTVYRVQLDKSSFSITYGSALVPGADTNRKNKRAALSTALGAYPIKDSWSVRYRQRCSSFQWDWGWFNFSRAGGFAGRAGLASSAGTAERARNRPGAVETGIDSSGLKLNNSDTVTNS